LYSFFS